MNAGWNWKTITGLVLHGLIGAMMVLAGSAKVLGLFPPEEVEKMGLGPWIRVIGAGELGTAVLLLFPRTASLGVLLASAFWGGAICLHMSKGDPIVLQSVLLLLTWAGASLRVPAMFSSFAAPAEEPSAAPARAFVS